MQMAENYFAIQTLNPARPSIYSCLLWLCLLERQKDVSEKKLSSDFVYLPCDHDNRSVSLVFFRSSSPR